MYRTGDWVRLNADGECMFAGRIDGQVKIRGYRVELAEIDACLRQLPGIESAVVRVVGEDADRQLAAYLVPQHWAAQDEARQAVVDGIRAALKLALPEHLVPHYLMLLEHLPVTLNGKVDVKALPEPVAVTALYRAPETALQMQVAAIWADVLQQAQVGLDDNFFALGGHSLLATQVVSRIRQQLRLDVALRALFDTADLSGFVEALQGLEQVAGERSRCWTGRCHCRFRTPSIASGCSGSCTRKAPPTTPPGHPLARPGGPGRVAGRVRCAGDAP